MKNKYLLLLYIIFDGLISAGNWTFLFYYRQTIYEPYYPAQFFSIFNDPVFFIGVICIILFWYLLYYHFGFYSNIYKKSRLQEILQTSLVHFFGIILLALLVFYDDLYPLQKIPEVVLLFFLLQNIFIIFHRLFWISLGKTIMKKGYKPFATAILFDEYYPELLEKVLKNIPLGYKLKGYINHREHKELKYLDFLGKYDNLKEIVAENDLQDVLILSANKALIVKILNTLAPTQTIIRSLGNIDDIVLRQHKINRLENIEFYEIFPDLMPLWEKNIKQTFDFLLSFIAIILLIPFYVLIILLIYFTSKGSVFYTQNRIGKNGKSFKIIKFRTMYPNSENGIPKLSSYGDPRITSIGKFLRKWRLDEFPQFINVIKGDMSIVGYRAEREYFIDQIVSIAPYYQHLYRAKPGLTSLGMVKYGYAENVEQMIERLKYDILYIENMSLVFDLKIIIQTINILLKGIGR